MLSVLLLGSLIPLFAACSSDDDTQGDAYFYVEGNPTGLAVAQEGISTDLTKARQYIVRSNRNWKIVAQEEGSWVRVFPTEGDADGIFRVSVSKNATFEDRTMNFAFVVEGEEQPTLFRVEQKAAVPYINVTGTDKGITVNSKGEDVTVPIDANVEWDYELINGAWLTVKSITSTEMVLTAGRNTDDNAREATLVITGKQFPSLTGRLTLTQASAAVILTESFSWLSYGDATHWETTGETAITKWNASELAHGWTSLSGWCYARPGFVKLGKTSYGGDIISPKFTGIPGTENVLVSFKATAYISKGGAKDDNLLYVGVMGPGTISGGERSTTLTAGGQSLTVVQFTIDNYPNSSNMEQGESYDVWDASIAERVVTITGATSETRVAFFGGAFDAALGSVGQGKNRIFLDDIKVELK